MRRKRRLFCRSKSNSLQPLMRSFAYDDETINALSLFFLSKSWFSLPYWSAGKTKNKTKQKQRWHFLEWNNPNRRSRDSRDSSRPLIGRRERFVDDVRWRKQTSRDIVDEWLRNAGSRCPNWTNSRESLAVEKTFFGPSFLAVRLRKNTFESRCFEQKGVDYLVVLSTPMRPFLLSPKTANHNRKPSFRFGNGNITKKHRCVNWCAVDTTEQSWRPLGPKEKEEKKEQKSIETSRLRSAMDRWSFV